MGLRYFVKELQSIKGASNPSMILLTGAWIAAFAIAAMVLAALGLLHRTHLGDVLHEHVKDRPRRRMFLASVSFLLTFAGLRLLTWSIHNNIGPFHDVQMGGRHIHHLVWGVLLLLLVGYAWLAEIGTGEVGTSLVASRLMALLYGAAAALTLDEFALWLNLRDVYWAKEGRSSLDAGILFLAVLSVGAWGAPLWLGLWRKSKIHHRDIEAHRN